MAALALSVFGLLGIGSPGHLVFTDHTPGPPCDFFCAGVSAADPATGTTEGPFIVTDGELFTEVSAGADGSVAVPGLFYIEYYSPGATQPGYVVTAFLTQRLALERYGDILLDRRSLPQFGGPPPGLYRYRVRFDTLALVSPGALRDVALGASGEIFVVNDAGTAIEAVNESTGARTAVSFGGLLGAINSVAVEPTGDLVTIDASFGLVRVELPGGAQQLLSTGGGIEAGVAIAAAADGTLYVTLPGGSGPDGQIVRVEPSTGSQSLQTLDRVLYEPRAVAVMNCDDVGGVCSVPPECTTDADCDDGLSCTGADVCVSGRCQAGADLCPGGIACVADLDACFECSDSFGCIDGSFCNGTESCDGNFQCLPGSDPCSGQLCSEALDACVECLAASDCADDGLFCSGAPLCGAAGQCMTGPDPCPGLICDEAGDSCVECFASSDCDDGLFCNGAESCAGNACNPGVPPCASPYSCNEGADQCVPPTPLDFDLSGLHATRRVRLSTSAPIELRVTARNAGSAAETAELTLTGVQNAATVFTQVQLVSLDPGRRTTLAFAFTPAATGDVTWTASVVDADPDVDVLTATSAVNP